MNIIKQKHNIEYRLYSCSCSCHFVFLSCTLKVSQFLSTRRKHTMMWSHSLFCETVWVLCSFCVIRFPANRFNTGFQGNACRHSRYPHGIVIIIGIPAWTMHPRIMYTPRTIAPSFIFIPCASQLHAQHTVGFNYLTHHTPSHRRKTWVYMLYEVKAPWPLWLAHA